MAITSVASRGSVAFVTVGTSNTFALTTPATVAVGNVLVAVMAMDNSFTAGASQLVQLSFTQTPEAGSWIPLGTVTNDPGAVNEGLQLYAWYCKVGLPLDAAETLTIGAAVSIGRATFACREFSGILVRGGPDDRDTATGTAGTTATAPATTVGTAGDLVIALGGVETNAALTGDADTTDGSWVTSHNFASNSGTAATSIAMIFQYKITTGTSAQNWSATWAGAADWAAMAIVVPAAPTPADPDYPPANPHYPCVAGMEYLPTRDANRTVDTGSGYNVLFPWPESSDGQTYFRGGATFVEPNARSQHIVSLEFSDEGRYLASLSDNIETVVLPLREAAVRDPMSGLDTTATDTVGTSLDPDTYPGGNAAAIAYVLDALSEAGGNYVIFDTNTARPFLDFYFDPTILGNYPNHRIVRVGLRYLAWKDDGSPDIPGEGFAVSLNDTQTVRTANVTGAEITYGNWLVPEYRRNAAYQTRWLGETNLINRGAFDIGKQNYANYECHPFTITDLNRMANGVEQFYIKFTGQPGYDLLQTVTVLDYVEMVVELVPERRLLVGNRIVSNLVSSSVGDYSFGADNHMQMHYSLNPESVIAMDFAAGENMVYTVRQAFPATPSDRLRVDPDGSFDFTFAESIGPSLQMYGVQQLRNFEPLSSLAQFFETVLVNGLPEVSSLTWTDYIYSAVFWDGVNLDIYGPFWVDAQLFAYPSYRYAGSGGYAIQQAIQVDGTTEFHKIRVFCRPGILTDQDLDISIEQPLATPIATATITVADWEAAGDVFALGDSISYREVIVDLDAPVTPAAGTVYVNLTSTSADPWDVASIRSLNGSFSYEWFEGDVSEADDAAVVLLCELPVPDSSVANTSISNMAEGAPCVNATMTVPEITVANADDYDYVVISRSIDGGSSFTVLDTVAVEGALTIEWTDYGVPWDCTDIIYQVTGWRDGDQQSASSQETWAGPATAPGAAFGLTDYDAGETYLYTPVSNGELEVQWSPLNPIQTVQLHGVDYQIALRAPEERGMSVSVVIAVRNFTQCSTDAVVMNGETLSAGQQSMNPKPFDVIRHLENLCRLQLALPGGHTRWVSLDLGTMSVRTVNGVYLAEITLTDLAPLGENPYDN